MTPEQEQARPKIIEYRPMRNGAGTLVKMSDGRWVRFYSNGDVRFGWGNHVSTATSGKPYTKSPPLGNHVYITSVEM